jgi:hypothetical protein
VYQAQGSVIPSDDARGIPVAGFGKALGRRNEDFGDRSRLSIRLFEGPLNESSPMGGGVAGVRLQARGSPILVRPVGRRE